MTATTEPATLPDLDLLDAGIDWAATHPEWDQTDWRCGTGMCLFGAIATLGGAVWLTDPVGNLVGDRPRRDDGQPVSDMFLAEWGPELVRSPGATHFGILDVEHVQCWVRRRLRVTGPEATLLSSGWNTLTDLYRIRDSIAGRPWATP